MNPISLYPDYDQGKYIISIDNKGHLKTPKGKLYSSYNKEIIETTIFDLQRYEQVKFKKNNSLIGEPIEKISIYSLYSTELDYWNKNKLLDVESVKQILGSDPFTNIAPGPESVDQLYQWRTITSLLNKFKHDFYKIQYFEKDEKEITNLASHICDDFNSNSNSKKSIFINLLNIFESPIASWALTYHELNDFAFVTAFTQTAAFIGGIPDLVYEELRKRNPDIDDEDELFSDDDLYDEIYNNKKKEIFNEFIEILNICNKFKYLSSKLPSEVTLEESLTHEYKSSFRKPYPNYPEPEINEHGQKVFKLSNKYYKSEKELQKFIEEQSLKTIVAFLNTKGGTLVIGVKEKNNIKEIVGINRDHYENDDKYERHICQQISNRIGNKFLSDFINIRIEIIEGKSVCLIECLPFIPKVNQVPALLDDEKCYRRTGPRTDEIKTGRDLATFVSERVQLKN